MKPAALMFAALFLLVSGCAGTEFSAPVRQAEPYPVATQAVGPPMTGAAMQHRVWLPIVATSGAWRGVSVTGGHALIPASMWRYKWSHFFGDLGPNQVPMLKERVDHDAAMRYFAERNYCGLVLFLNEPSRKGMAVAQAAEWYGEIVAARPCLDIIAGGVMWTLPGAQDWLEQFRLELVARGLPMPHGWHVHDYSHLNGTQTHPVLTVRAARAWMNEHGLAGELWLTEFAWCRSDVDSATFEGWLRDLDAEPGLQRYAIFATRRTNEFHRCGEWWMIDNAGQLTPAGELYFNHD